MSGSNTPEVIPAYGEAGPEAESMNKAANKAADRAGNTGTDAANASDKVLPDDVAVEGHGTTEVDIPGRIAETAGRAGQQRQT